MNKPALASWLLAIVAVSLGVYRAAIGYTPAQNPDPNHTHADFAVWIGDQKLDFSGDEFMSGLSTDPNSHPTEGPKKFLHLHDGNGDVIHRHKPGLTLREFFESLGTTFREGAMGNSRNLCVDFPQVDDVCQDEAAHKDWIMVVNGTQSFFDPAYVFEDGDQILIMFNDTGDDPQALIDTRWAELTDDACLYSRTCPWRGPAPTENCIADPTVPCVVQ